MKLNIKINFRTTIVLLFVIIYSASLMLFNTYFNRQQELIQKTYNAIDIDKSFVGLNFKSEADTLIATNIMKRYSQAKSTTNLIVGETKIYSTIFLFTTMVIAIGLFILIFLNLTKPLKELNEATAKIIEGDFSVHLPETGLSEMKQLKQSFNEMSKELENVQQRLLESEKQIIWKEISRILAHEIKNPLTPIQLSIQRLEEKYEMDREKFVEIFPESAQMIYTEIDNLRNLVQSFSKFAKVAKPNFSEINISESVNEILKPYISTYNIEQDISKECSIMFDPTHFYQVFTNLIQNAIDAIEKVENGKIEIKLLVVHHYVILEVMDNGIGIKEEDFSRIFEPYFSKKKRGTGLGLALVKRLVESNKAHIRVKSIQNSGTKFEIYIPLIEGKEC